jgi:coniferyl-aldehyde dehydrogenase
MSVDRLHQVFAAQRAAAAADPMPSIAVRLDRLVRLKSLLDSEFDRIADAVVADFGTLPTSAVFTLDTLPVTSRVDHVSAHLAQWMAPRDVDLGPEHGSSTGRVLRVPKGVCGNIAPWNFPVESALVMAVDMLAAGNTVIVKPSELAPATADVLETLVGEWFDPTELAVVCGDVELATAFASMPWDHLTYTGGGRVGRLVAQAAASNLVPCTLELGGKNPALFAPDGVTDELVGRFLAFRALKAGQICTSPDYVLCPRDQIDTWVHIASRWWRERCPTWVDGPGAVSIINDHHLHRLVGYLDEAMARGVRVVGLNDDVVDVARRLVPMTLVVDPPADLGCMVDEVFGPVVPVVPYDSVDEAMARINAGPSPLGAYLASRDDALAERFTLTVRSGGTGLNTFGLQGGHAALPFGGFGASGMGCHSGFEGFCNYSHTKSVFHGADDSFVHQVIQPPYVGG